MEFHVSNQDYFVEMVKKYHSCLPTTFFDKSFLNDDDLGKLANIILGDQISPDSQDIILNMLRSDQDYFVKKIRNHWDCLSDTFQNKIINGMKLDDNDLEKLSDLIKPKPIEQKKKIKVVKKDKLDKKNKDLYQTCLDNQQKKVGRQFKEHPIPTKLQVKRPSIQILKIYSRFNKEAKEAGYLKYPVSTTNDPIKVFDISSSGFMRDLSPMVMGPVVDEFGDVLGCNIEDAWQGMKVWQMHLDGHDPKKDKWIPSWDKWSRQIRFSGEGKRHRAKIDKSGPNPNVPLFSYYRGYRLPYHRARKLMYVRWYAKLVQETRAFKYLKKLFDAGVPLVLLDPDGQPRDQKIIKYNRQNAEKLMSDRINNPKQIFGHGFVLACVLLGVDVWSDETYF